MIQIVHNKFIFVNHNFYLKGKNCFTKVDGKKFSLPDYPGLDMFLYKNKIGFWCVVDGFTGRRLTKINKELSTTMKEIKKTLQYKPEVFVLNKIFLALKNSSLSPRYKYIANPTRKRCGILKK